MKKYLFSLLTTGVFGLISISAQANIVDYTCHTSKEILSVQRYQSYGSSVGCSQKTSASPAHCESFSRTKSLGAEDVKRYDVYMKIAEFLGVAKKDIASAKVFFYYESSEPYTPESAYLVFLGNNGKVLNQAIYSTDQAFRGDPLELHLEFCANGSEAPRESVIYKFP